MVGGIEAILLILLALGVGVVLGHLCW